MTLRIILPTCGADCFQDTIAQLWSWLLPAFSDYELIVIYNDSGRFSRSLVTYMMSQWTLPSKELYLSDRCGYVKAVHEGWKLADPAPDDYIAVLNDDVVIDGDWITPLVEMLQREPFAQVGRRLRRIGPDGLGYPSRGPTGRKPIGYYNYLEGWCWMARAEAIQQAGGIVDLEFEGSYCEDCDLSIRIRDFGGPILEVPAPIHHIGHQSSSPETQAQWVKNRKYLAEKWDLTNGGLRSSPARNGGWPQFSRGRG